VAIPERTEGSGAIDGSCAGDYLLRTVAISVRRHQLVVATAGGCAVSGHIAGRRPSSSPTPHSEGQRRNRQTRVVATLLDDARPPGGNARLLHELPPHHCSVPTGCQPCRPTPYLPAGHRIVHRRQFLAGSSHRTPSVLGPGKNHALAPRYTTLSSSPAAGPVLRYAPVPSLVPGGGLARHFRLPVAVEVVDENCVYCHPARMFGPKSMRQRPFARPGYTRPGGHPRSEATRNLRSRV